ncbi:MAG: glycosyltransferase family 4 protein, partial [Actinomycetota bacterium]|nr:glycosyltransferase family 4 protein [Actinomycetota bacterium]
MRIALVSPYSWTYPGGVTRHIEGLAEHLLAAGHDVRVLAPVDPDDRLAARSHRGARPQARELPEWVVPLGRTVGLPANGAVSNLLLTPTGVNRLRTTLASGGFDVVHVHEPIAPAVGWDALAADLPLVGTFHAYSTNAVANGLGNLAGARRRLARLRVRIAVSPAAAWTAQRFFGGDYRVIPNGVWLGAGGAATALGAVPPPASEDGWAGPGSRPLPASLPASRSPARPPDSGARPPSAASRPLRIAFVGQAVQRKGLPVLLAAFEALREQVPATLTVIGADEAQVAPLLLDPTALTAARRGTPGSVAALGKVSDEEKVALLREADVLCAPSLGGESFGMVLTEAFAAGTPVVASDLPGYAAVVDHGRDGLLVPRGDAGALAGALRDLAVDPA